MDFISGAELLHLCREEQCDISEMMIRRELSETEDTREHIMKRMLEAYTIMKNAAKEPLEREVRSMGGLIGGEAMKLHHYHENGSSLCGTTISLAITYAMAVPEVNASMGLIVAAPTAGASGVVPGVLLALQEVYQFSDECIVDSLFTAGAVGYLFMRNASVSGAEAGCQAEVGVASAMAASAAVRLMKGTPEQSLQAASIATANLLGLVCDPIAGLVESPCQGRNAMGAGNALICAELALSGVSQQIPFDEMVETMYQVGGKIPSELRETAKGGCAACETGIKIRSDLISHR